MSFETRAADRAKRRTVSPSPVRDRPAASSVLLDLQHTAGNQAVQSLFVQRLKDTDVVPVWNPADNAVGKGVGSDIPSDQKHTFIVRTKFGSVVKVPLSRAEINDAADGVIKDTSGRTVLAYVKNENDAGACLAQLKEQANKEAETKQKTVNFIGAGEGKAATSNLMSSLAGIKQTRGPSSSEQKLPPDPILLLSAFQRAWFNCGETAATVKKEIEDLGGAPRQTTKDLRLTPKTIKQLKEILAEPRKNPVLVDCTFEGVHTFTIEVQTDGKCYLHQGYQGAYSAFWWQELAERPEDMSLRPDAPLLEIQQRKQQLASTAEKRKDYGGGQALGAEKVGAITGGIESIFSKGEEGKDQWNTAAYNEFVKLPIYPAEGEFTFTATDAKIEEQKLKDQQFFMEKTGKAFEEQKREAAPLILVVNVFEITNPKTVYEALKGQPPESLGSLAIKGANQKYEKALESKKQKAVSGSQVKTNTNF